MFIYNKFVFTTYVIYNLFNIYNSFKKCWN